MASEAQNETPETVQNEIRKSRFELLIELANHVGQILNIDTSDEKVRRCIEFSFQKRDELLMWAQTAFHMYDRHLAEKAAEAANSEQQKEANAEQDKQSDDKPESADSNAPEAEVQPVQATV